MWFVIKCVIWSFICNLIAALLAIDLTWQIVVLAVMMCLVDEFLTALTPK